MDQATAIMCRHNNNALIGKDEDGAVSMIEDWTDPDGRMYRMEYRSTEDGNHTLAYCRYNPWGNGPNSGVSYATGHVASDGLLCLGSEHGTDFRTSPYDLATVISRARYWCTGFSVLKETGTFPQL